MAFGKLHGLLGSKALALPGKNAANIAMAAGSAAAAAALFTTGEPAVGLAALGATAGLGGVMGAHMTASIGGVHQRSSLVYLRRSKVQVPASAPLHALGKFLLAATWPN